MSMTLSVSVNRERITSPTLHVVGLALMFLAPGLLFSALIEWGSSTSNDEWPLFISAALCLAVGATLRNATQLGDVRTVSIFSIVAWTWIASSVFGALPYLLGSMFDWSQWDSALFESVSGFSCTGSTVLDDIEANGRGILMWRQLTQWYGGMGMVVLAVTVLPYLGVGGLALMTAEAPGHSSDRLAPRVSETAKRLWLVYTGITGAIALTLWIVPGPSLYDSLAHAFTTAATGGFSPYNSSVGFFDSVVVEVVLIVGMVVSGMSFALHYRAITGDPGVYRRSADTVAYLWMLAIATVLVWFINWREGLGSVWTTLRHGAFNLVSLGTSTGYGNVRGHGLADFVLWAGAAQIILLALMVVGGCVGSTAGGIKTYRALIGVKHMARELRRLRHRQGIFPIKLGPEAVPEEIVASALAFLILFTGFLVIGTLSVAATGADLLTAASAVISAMSNMGPALGEAGPTANFTVFTRPARMILAALMLIGRLEIYAVMLMFASTVRRVRHARRSLTV
ncbi:MAG: TrkH family potassium uptake protein [Acidimicrobiales bacterium]